MSTWWWGGWHSKFCISTNTALTLINLPFSMLKRGRKKKSVIIYAHGRAPINCERKKLVYCLPSGRLVFLCGSSIISSRGKEKGVRKKKEKRKKKKIYCLCDEQKRVLKLRWESWKKSALPQGKGVNERQGNENK